MMWQRKSRDQKSGLAVKHAVESGEAGRVRVLADLLRPTMWEQLSDAEREKRIADQLLPSAEVLRAENGHAALNAWIATAVTPCLQPEATAGIRGWLTTAPEHAHLFLGGRSALGYAALATSIARQFASTWPTPTGYCYVPDPADVSQALLITLPLGTSVTFGTALLAATDAICTSWTDAGNRADTVTSQLAKVSTVASADLQRYLGNLRDTLLALAQADAPLPWCGDKNSAPILAIASEPEVTSGGPVVDTTIASLALTTALLRANGGVLVLDSNAVDFGDLLIALRQRIVLIQDGLTPIPIDVRVVLLGAEDTYEKLAALEEFTLQFRYEAWCQDVTAWTSETESAYASLAQAIARRHALPTVLPSAVGRLIQESARRSDGVNRSRLLADLIILQDITIEAGKIAHARASAQTAGEDVDTALAQRRSYQRIYEQWTREAILSGESITPTTGVAIGQINGLGICEWHPREASFAVPSRISATVSPGRDESLLDIEQQASQADADHMRGNMTVEGYLSHRYGQKHTLPFAARIRFEQEHGTTAGDSASGAVLFAILSALADVPIHRSIAITGAIGQYGEMQPIGGVNTKIAGFWDLCNVRRTMADQAKEGYGVIIPAANARDLMLRSDVAQSIANDGWFSVWLVETVEEAVPLLMDCSAAVLDQRIEGRLADFGATVARTR